ncbi:MAG: ABC transporter permease subunit [Phycisphaerales bacterium]|nr:ABC transporter permease subunit [Phycisphaerales bacterium]
MHATDRLAELVISTGGFLVIVAVLGICVYLAYVVLPLFTRGTVGERAEVAASVPAGPVVLDQYRLAMAVVDSEGTVRAYLMSDGSPLGEPVGLTRDAATTVISVARNGQLVATGHENGTVRLGSIGFRSTTVRADPARRPGEVWSENGDIFEVTETGRARRTTMSVEMGAPVALADGSGAVVRIDYRIDPTGRTVLLAVREDGTVAVNTVRTIRPLGGGAPTTRLSASTFSVEPDAVPRWAFVTADSEHVLLVDPDGTVRRYARAGSAYERAETIRGVPEGVTVTAANMLLGAQTLLLGDEHGMVRSWHVAGFDEEGALSRVRRLVMSHEVEGADSAVIEMSPSVRDRSIVILGADGGVRVRHMTSEKVVTSFDAGLPGAAVARLFPRNNGLLVLGSDGSYMHRSLAPGFPQFSFKALFGRVHYEGLAEPEFVYQSSAGDDASETKLSLVPLIFGSLKATVFAMLFAVPMGVLAAVYTSEFLSHRVRRVVKPGVEIMASLPSVVLGFVAAIIVAPFVREWLPSVLVGIGTIPVAVLLSAHLWQLVPLSLRKRMRSGQHLLLVLAACGFGVAAAVAMGPWFERALFAPPESAGIGLQVDMRRWLASEYGPGWPGWFVVLLGPAAIVLAVIQSVLFGRRIDALLRGRTALFGAVFVLARLLVMLLLVGLASFGLAIGLDSMGFDPRDSIFGPFSPRNTLVVAMIMGFAVIPIIYTISEDSLRAVPDSLRAASLGAGATPWQTAMRIVIPVAGSGIFSACMIGFGRAAGETMIVLMATGNTPEMSWNIFGGFRTLSANIAVELPEAPKGGTHYRVLFLCGLVLFLMTFVINTCAEVVRQVVRSRTAGL